MCSSCGPVLRSVGTPEGLSGVHYAWGAGRSQENNEDEFIEVAQLRPGVEWRTMSLIKRAAVAAGGFWGASVLWTVYSLTKKGVRIPLDHEYFYTPFEMEIPFDAVGFYNSEGIQLRGWWLERPSTTKVIIICSGYGRNKSDLLGIGSYLWRAGYNVFMFDFRDQGESEAAISTIGHYECDDMEAAIDYALWRLPGAEIGLMGYSMGAAASIMTAARRTEVRAVVSDSAFADLGRVLRATYRQVAHLPPRPAVDFAEWLVWLRAGYRFSRVRPVDYVASVAPRPLFIIHGDQDAVAPIGDAFELYEAAGEPKELWVAEGCPHCGIYFLDRKAYVERVVGFFERWLGKAEEAGPLPQDERLGGSAGQEAAR